MGRPSPTARRAVVAERRAKAIELRYAGVDPVTIGQRLGYGRWRPNATVPLEQREQLSTDSSLARMVRQDITRGLDDRRTDLVMVADTLRIEQTERLERLRSSRWADALKGDPASLHAVLAIEGRLAKLWGLDKPIRQIIDVSVATAQVEAAVVELVQLVDQSLPSAEGAPHRLALEA